MTWDHGWLNQGAAIAGAMRGIACRGAMHYASQARPWLGYEKHRDRGGAQPQPGFPSNGASFRDLASRCRYLMIGSKQRARYQLLVPSDSDVDALNA